MAIVRWDPFRELENLSARLDRFLGRGPARSNGGEGFLSRADWLPPVDVTETDQEYCVCAELPAVDKNDVKVEVENGALRIHGERKEEKTEERAKMHLVERRYGSFTRSFPLPGNVDESKVSAEFKEGVLTVHLPKGAEPKPHGVEVKVD